MPSPPIPPYPRVTLRKGAHRRLASGHPWVYSNEVNMDPAAKAIAAGSVVTLTDAAGKPMATGYFNPRTLIAARVLTAGPDVAIDETFFVARLQSALTLREKLFAEPYYRLVHAEADGFPGLIVDRFGDAVVLQPNTAGMELMLDTIGSALDTVLAPRIMVARGDGAVRALEGLEDSVRCLRGEPAGPITVRESALTYFADLLAGQKTGWFFDQRENRAFMASISRGVTALDLYTHTGGFALACLKGGAAAVTAVDGSATALELAARAAAANDLSDNCVFTKSDVFSFLQSAQSEGRQWGVVIADPPRFVKSRKDIKAGLQGYRKLSRLSASVTAPGGFLFLASCSHNAKVEDFTAAVVRGMADAGRTGRIIRASGAGPDHPVHPLLPESAYLKALVLQVD